MNCSSKKILFFKKLLGPTPSNIFWSLPSPVQDSRGEEFHPSKLTFFMLLRSAKQGHIFRSTHSIPLNNHPRARKIPPPPPPPFSSFTKIRIFKAKLCCAFNSATIIWHSLFPSWATWQEESYFKISLVLFQALKARRSPHGGRLVFGGI